MNTDTDNTLSAAELATFLHLSPEQVGELTLDGILRPDQDSRYSRHTSARRVVTHLRRLAAGVDDAEP